MGEHNPARAALTAVLRQGEFDLDEPGHGEREDAVEDLVGLSRLDATRSTVQGNAGKGRPKGAHNYKTQRWVSYITGRYGSPIEGLMQTACLPVDQLARELGCTRLDALREKRACWAAAAPYIHARLSTVEVKPLGSPDGEPVLLRFASEPELIDGEYALDADRSPVEPPPRPAESPAPWPSLPPAAGNRRVQ